MRSRTDLTTADLESLHLLLGEWQLVADLSFADLVLWVPTRGGSGFVAVAHVRPTTAATALPGDQIGREADRDEVAEVARAAGSGGIVGQRAIAVQRAGRTIAVIDRVRSGDGQRRQAAAEDGSVPTVESVYLSSADELAQMVAEGRFPFPAVFSDPESSPRAGDGLIRLDPEGRVLFASPNALSAYRRLGVIGDLTGVDLGEVTSELLTAGPVDEDIIGVCRGRVPRAVEIEAGGAHVLLRSIPLRPGGRRLGALVLLRDITDLARRDRVVATKDATIREVHHRVKNNLQTVAALLRLQSRRLDSAEARMALDEAVRRVGSIAVVHETLSQTPDEVVVFDDVADRLLAMVVDVGSTADAPQIETRRSGAFGVIPAEVATPLAMALTEVLLNAIQHGLAGLAGEVSVHAVRSTERLVVDIVDDGRGLPAGFAVENSERLGLQIVRTLVVSELGGQFSMELAPGGGTRARIDVPLS